jgi:hypothetical protein
MTFRTFEPGGSVRLVAERKLLSGRFRLGRLLGERTERSE